MTPTSEASGDATGVGGVAFHVGMLYTEHIKRPLAKRKGVSYMSKKSLTFYRIFFVLCALLAISLFLPWATYTGRAGSYSTSATGLIGFVVTGSTITGYGVYIALSAVFSAGITPQLFPHRRTIWLLAPILGILSWTLAIANVNNIAMSTHISVGGYSAGTDCDVTVWAFIALGILIAMAIVGTVSYFALKGDDDTLGKPGEKPAPADPKEAERQAKEEAERQAKKEAERKRREELAPQRRKALIKWLIIGGSVLVVVAVVVLVVAVLIPSGNYNKGDSLEAKGDYLAAAEAFEAAGNYKDAPTRYRIARAKASYKTIIGVGMYHSVGLKEDGTVAVAGSNLSGKHEVLEWTDLISVGAGYDFTVGLKADGTVVAAGDNGDDIFDARKWTNIVSLSASKYSHVVGLKKDGTVVAVGDNKFGQCKVSGWTDIIAVAAGGFHTVGLKVDGTVESAGNNECEQCNLAGWTDIVAVSAGTAHTVGLKADGTVVAAGDNEDGQCDVEDWTDIIAVAAGEFHTVGLKADGTVVATGYNEYDVSDWTDIVAIFAGERSTLGLKKDGTVVVVGSDYATEYITDVFANIQLP